MKTEKSKWPLHILIVLLLISLVLNAFLLGMKYAGGFHHYDKKGVKDFYKDHDEMMEDHDKYFEERDEEKEEMKEKNLEEDKESVNSELPEILDFISEEYDFTVEYSRKQVVQDCTRNNQGNVMDEGLNYILLIDDEDLCPFTDGIENYRGDFEVWVYEKNSEGFESRQEQCESNIENSGTGMDSKIVEVSGFETCKTEGIFELDQNDPYISATIEGQSYDYWIFAIGEKEVIDSHWESLELQ